MNTQLECPAQQLSESESKELLALCRTGRLYDIERWIQAGRSISLHTKFKKSPLQVAIEQHFHSLVELLARHENDESIKRAALVDALAHRKIDLVDLLLQSGVAPNSIPFLEVLHTWDPALMRRFLELGADPITGSPFAEAFGAKIRTALRPFREYKDAHPEHAKDLQAQLDSALRNFCYEGNLKWVSLLLWAGANPRSLGPKLHDDDDPESFTTGLQEACYGGHLEVLKRLHPGSNDDLSNLLGCCAFLSRKDVVNFLLSLGASPNDKANGGSSFLHSCLLHLRFEAWRPWRSKALVSKYDVTNTLGCAELLLQHGARWEPNDDLQIRDLRSVLLLCEVSVTEILVQLFTKYECCTKESLQRLLCSKKMKEHYPYLDRKLQRLGQKEVAAALNAGPKKRLKPSMSKWNYHSITQRYNRDKLYEQVWSQPMQRLAKEYGVSDVALAKTCRKLFIPVPGRGYWAKKVAGKQVPKRKELPPIEITD